MTHNLKKLYKKYIPPIIDATGYYDRFLKQNNGEYIVPMYHRIIKDSYEDPYELGMCVSKKSFEIQAAYFSENYNSVRLSEYVQRSNSADDYSKNITLTFDDGYKDTLEDALPIIQKYDLSAAVFVCIYSLINKENYWWDIVINSVKKSDSAYLNTNGLNIDLPKDLSIQGYDAFDNITMILNAMKKLNHKEAYSVSRKIKDRLINDNESFVDKLSEADIVALYKNGVEIGSHTMTHPDLRMLSKNEMIKEVKESKSVLEEIIGDEVHGFAYPSGYYNQQVIDVVKDCGYQYALSADKGLNYSLDKFLIERLSMPDSNISDIKRCILDNVVR